MHRIMLNRFQLTGFPKPGMNRIQLGVAYLVVVSRESVKSGGAMSDNAIRPTRTCGLVMVYSSKATLRSLAHSQCEQRRPRSVPVLSADIVGSFAATDDQWRRFIVVSVAPPTLITGRT